MKKVLLLIFCLFLLFFESPAQVIVYPDDSKINYWGRIDFSDPKAPAFEYPGVTITAKFTGPSIAMKLHDYAPHTESSTNYFYKIIDGGAPEKFEALAGEHTYELATGLAEGSHTVQVIKLTEALVGKSAFLGFVLENGQSLVEVTDEPAYEIEFIGNSITSGYGNEISYIDPNTNPNPGFHSVNENNYKAWGYEAARELTMRYRAVSYSGRGMYRNNSGDTMGVIPKIYDRIFPDDESSPLWDHSAHHPNIIVINLGTNDFAPDTPLSEASYKSAYLSFVKRLKNLHPDATIICATGVMMNDHYPAGAALWTRITTYVKDVVNTLGNDGLSDIYYFQMTPQSAPYGEDWHPTMATHASMASQLVSFIKDSGIAIK